MSATTKHEIVAACAVKWFLELLDKHRGNIKAVKRELQHYDESADRLLADVITELF
jgi:hypothetical protein